MTQQHQRQEPTFGEPSSAVSPQTEAVQPTTPKLNTNLSFSLHSKQSPGHTFTPVLKRPAELAQHFSTLEEQEMLKHTPQKIEPEATTQPAEPTTEPRHFAFTPTEPEKHELHAEGNIANAQAESEPAAFKAESIFNSPKVAPSLNDTTPSEPQASPAMERVIPPQAGTPAKKTVATEKVPTKYRRLLLVLLLALALVLLFFLLKPKTPETVEELQQGTSLPIEFRPVDEAEAKRAEEEAKALQQQQQEAEQQAKAKEQQAVANSENSASNALPATMPVAPASATDDSASVTSTEPAKPNTQTSEVSRPLVVEPVKKTATQSSVIYQPEKPAVAKLEKVVKVEKAEKPKTVHSANTATPVKKAELKEPKSIPQEKPATTQSNNVAGSKVITAQKGVTLFQNFRDNGLAANLPELNKMTKLNGKTSELKPGQKIVLRFDAQKHIIEMDIGAGKYLRQADGSYIYK